MFSKRPSRGLSDLNQTTQDWYRGSLPHARRRGEAFAEGYARGRGEPTRMLRPYF